MPKNTDWLSHKDSQFDEWQLNFVTFAEAHMVDLGLTMEIINALKSSRDQWRTDYSAHTAAQDAALSATKKKNKTRNDYKKFLRLLEGQIEANPNVTDETRKASGLPARKKNKSPQPAPDTKPVLRVELKGHRANSVYCAGQVGDAAGTSRGMPNGVSGCELYMKVGGAAPVDETECKYVHLITRSPYKVEFAGADAGKTVYYLARWVNQKGQPGPWSDVTVATVPA